MNHLTRRTVLAASVGGSTWLVTGCSGYGAAGRGAAFAPWRPGPEERNPERLAVWAAILAASPHNTQPWKFRITEHTIDVFADRSKTLGAMDSLQREMFIGLGCAVENAVLSAKATRNEVSVAYLPSPADDSHVARLRLTPGASPTDDALHAAIGARHTNRFPYEQRVVPVEVLGQLPAVIEDERVRLVVVTDASERARMRQDCIDSVVAITRDEAMAEASHRWWRQTAAEVERHRDGLNLDGLGLPPLTRWFAGTVDSVSTATAGGYWVEAVEGRNTTGAGYVVLASRERNSREEQLAVGRAWQRLALFLTRHGVATQPINMLPELQDREETTGAAARPFTARCEGWLKPLGGGLQLIARFGYPERAAFPSARRAVEDVLV